VIELQTPMVVVVGVRYRDGKIKRSAGGRLSDRRIYCPLMVVPIDETCQRSSTRRTCRQSSSSNADTYRIHGATGVEGGVIRTG
jgi:hypothetical protein